MNPYAIGLDIGTTSVGWAIVALDENDRPCGIHDLGARIFEIAEHPKGASLAKPRRDARGTRRTLRRHRHRNERIRALIVRSGIISKDVLEHDLFAGNLEDIYALRVRALDEPITASEFARILIHLSQRRGFRSNRKNASDEEDGKLLTAISENKARMERSGYRTVAEMLLKDPAFQSHKRNKVDDYQSTVTRDMVEDEAHKIFSAQRSFDMRFASSEIEEAYLNILLSQRSYDEGPGGNSPYAGDQIAMRVGKCTFFPDEPRAAKATYSFEYFSLLQKISHIRLVSPKGGMALNDTQRQKLVQLALNPETDDINFSKIRKELGIDDAFRFNMIRYGDNPAESEKKEKLRAFKCYHQMRKAFEKVNKGRFSQFTRDQLNAIATALSLYRTTNKIHSYLSEYSFTESDFEAIDHISSFSGFGHIGVKACDCLIPYLEQGLTYNAACEKAGFDFRAHDGRQQEQYLHLTEDDYADVTSPVVKRSVSQSVKVINAIIRRMKESPVFVNIEMARELAQTLKERNKSTQLRNDNQAENERIKQRIETEFQHSNPSGQDIIKLRLWEEQDGICLYSGKPIDLRRLFEPGYAEIDHIIPYSISFDDSRKNKVLVLGSENRQKGNRLPLEYLTGQKRDDFIVRVRTSVRNPQKRTRLLREAVSEDDRHQLRERALQDTKTATVFMGNLLRDRLTFAEFSSGRKKHVTCVNGIITSYLRKRWGLQKNRENGDLHHAVDALVIACTTDGMIQELSRHIEYRECEYRQTTDTSHAIDPATGEVLSVFPMPWPKFRDELDARMSQHPSEQIKKLHLPMYESGRIIAPELPPFVSRMPKRKITGEAHEATARQETYIDGKRFTVAKQPLTALKLKNGQIENYYAPESDRLLYDALLARLLAFNGNAKKAFAEPFHKPKHDGTPGPIVNKVKIAKPSSDSIPIQNHTAFADKANMIRIDIFFIPNDGYYFIPIYVADTLKPTLPQRACVPKKSIDQWKEISDDCFVFSLYPNDLIYVQSKKELTLTPVQKNSALTDSFTVQRAFLYYKSANINNASIECITHDNGYGKESLGVKTTLTSLQKMSVDILGEIHPISREKRLPFHRKKNEGKPCPSAT